MRAGSVLNSGFCPRAERNSIDLFVECLTFKEDTIKDLMLPPTSFKGSSDKTKLYAPPLSEFNVLAIQLSKGEKEEVRAIEGPSIMLCGKGEGSFEAGGKKYDLKEGWIYFIGQGVKTSFEATSKEGLRIYHAHAE
jgi:mannose-6-phosphate isomerase